MKRNQFPVCCLINLSHLQFEIMMKFNKYLMKILQIHKLYFLQFQKSVRGLNQQLEYYSQNQIRYTRDIAKNYDRSIKYKNKKFKTVDQIWKHNLKFMLQQCLRRFIGKIAKQKQKFRNHLKGTIIILEKKRVKFARICFSFIDDLLEILSQTKEPTAVQLHLRRVLLTNSTNF
ncbi:unnamed protein product [Paramecium sonneborni]|uniref:Dynein heavy chain linker domain-containing protein n=1 Tax=Paramecium sonneborni TaxID=65129 RepID=A0A8S1RSC0_9CILI|nr:unnamed protein product [Paramecium sonneborni]